MSDSFYFRQLLAGQAFARDAPYARRMQNYCYLIGDRDTGEALVVDPAWDVGALVTIAENDGMTLTGALVTHYHPDHVGGDMFGIEVEGLAKLLELRGMKAHVHKLDADGVRKLTGLATTDIEEHDGGDRIRVGDVELTLLHTPGHTPGSQCFLVRDRLVSGDTLFIQGCGRVDLPGGDSDEMYRSLNERFSRLDDAVVLYPGHDYADVASATMGEQRATNHVLTVPSLEDWHRLMG